MAKGDTKTNQYLDIAANGTRADLPADTCCETRSQTLIREVAERIMDVEDEVEEIKNNPDVVDVVPTYAALQAYDTQHLTDKDIIRVLQDETHDGESTYYRYNKQSDTWTYVGESKQYDDFVGTDGTTAGVAGLVPAPAATDTDKYLKSDGTWEEVGAGGPTVVQTTGTSTTDVMSQNATTNAIKAISQSGAGAPTTSTVGTVGQLYQDTTNGDLYICTDATNPYVWEEVGAGGGGSPSITELTSADYNYDYGSTGTNNCIALWLLSEGTYSWAMTLRSSVRVTTTETAGDLSADGALVIAASNAILARVYLYGDGSATTATGRNILQMYRVNKTNGTSNVSGAAITTRELIQSTGNSQSDVMSQNATTSMVFADPSAKTRIRLGAQAVASTDRCIAIGYGATHSDTNDPAPTGASPNCTVAIGSESAANSRWSTAIGPRAFAYYAGSVALGAGSKPTHEGEVNIGSQYTDYGYNNSNYRLLTGLYDPQSDHDAATKGYVDPTTDSAAPTTDTVGTLGKIYIDTTTATAYMCVAVDTVTPAYTWKQITA